MPLLNTTSHMVGSSGPSLLGEILQELTAQPVAKTASAPEGLPEAQVLKMGRDMGVDLQRVAGHVYESRVAGNAYALPAKRDFWGVKGGKLVRLTGADTEVADDEHLDPADIEDPERSQRSIFADLEF